MGPLEESELEILDLTVSSQNAPDEIPTGAAAEAATEESARWPLEYNIPPWTRAKWFSHKLYRGPFGQTVRILYSDNIDQSEKIARQFLHETILGFDMEWQSQANRRRRLQDQVSLIQIACEDKIALFHLGLHRGKDADALIAPSLRAIIEDADIIKTGVAILSADFSRLKKYFRLQPRGGLDVNRLHCLIADFNKDSERANTRPTGLATLVEQHLGYRLFKGRVRTSQWAHPLSEDQKDYAASDAYSGYMLYHALNHKRTKLQPIPPHPQPSHTPQESNDRKKKTKVKLGKVNGASNPLLYETLLQWRHSMLEEGISVKDVLSHRGLKRIARLCPSNMEELKTVGGIGTRRLKLHAQTVLDIVIAFLKEHSTEALSPERGNIDADTNNELLATKKTNSDALDRESSQVTHASSSAYGSPLQRTEQRQTGNSFSLEAVHINSQEEVDLERVDSDFFSSELDFGDQSTEPMNAATQLSSRRTNQDRAAPSPVPSSGLKRKRHSDPVEDEAAIGAKRKTSTFLRSQLSAFRARVITMLPKARRGSTVSDETLDLIVARNPRTREELYQIRGAEDFGALCARCGYDLFDKIITFSRWKKIATIESRR
jgi:ribonuclease D